MVYCQILNLPQKNHNFSKGFSTKMKKDRNRKKESAGASNRHASAV